MSVLLTLGKIKVTPVKRRPMLVCVLGITLLTAACANEPSKQSTSINTSTDSLAINDNSDNKTAANGPELVCRYEAATGTRLKSRTCKTKRNWDAVDKQSKSSAEELVRTLQDDSGVPTDSDTSQGIVNSASQQGF